MRDGGSLDKGEVVEVDSCGCIQENSERGGYKDLVKDSQSECQREELRRCPGFWLVPVELSGLFRGREPRRGSGSMRE